MNLDTLKRQTWLYVRLLCLLFIGVENSMSSSVEFKRLEFREGYPEKAEPVDVSLRNLDRDQLRILELVATALKARRDFGVEVVGHADSKECAGDECLALSERRASLAYQWLFSHGANGCQLKGPTGASTNFSRAATDHTEQDRQFNRRVQFAHS